MISPRFVALSVLLTLSTTTLSVVEAANDWSKPCFNGVCEYDIPASTGSSGTVKIWGPVDAIADITPAGGWEILGCDPNALEQEIRLVCTQGDNDSRAACGKLFATDSTPSTDVEGAVGKVVRLPESCGKGPFALITKAWTPTDQSTPSRRSFVSRAESSASSALPASSASSASPSSVSPSSAASSSVASLPVASSSAAASPSASVAPTGGAPVRALRLETNFGSASSSTKAKRATTDPVRFAVKGANVPGATGIDDSALQRRDVSLRFSRRVVEERGLFDFVGDAIDAIKNLNNFSIDKNKDLPPLNLDKSFNLVNENVSCPPITASLKIDVDAKANALASIGLAASGTIIPPKVEDFAIIANLNAEIDGTLSLLAGVSGSADSGEIELFQIGIPGLDIPGIITLGPSFSVSGQVEAKLDLSINADVGINYKVQNAQLVFPPSSNKAKQQGTFNIGDTPLKLSASGAATATGSIEAHLIPALNLGISALGGLVDATVFLNLDASAKMELTAQAGVSGSVTVPVGGNNAKRDLPLLDDNADDDEIDDQGDTVEDEDVGARNFRRPVRRPTRPPPRGRPGRHSPPKPKPRPQPPKPVLIGKPNASSCPAPVTKTVTVVANPQATQTVVNGGHGGVKTTVNGGQGGVKTTVNGGQGGVKTTVNGGQGGVKTTSVGAPAQTSSAAGNVKTTSAAAPLPTKGLGGNIDIVQPESSAAASSGIITKGATATASSSAAAATTTTPGGIVKEGDVTFGGCFTIDAGLSVNAGANADFFGLFNKETKVELFSKEFELFKKCFGDQPNTKRDLLALESRQNGSLFGRSRFFARRPTPSKRTIARRHLTTRSMSTLERRVFDLACPAADSSEDPASLAPLADVVVAAADIKAA